MFARTAYLVIASRKWLFANFHLILFISFTIFITNKPSLIFFFTARQPEWTCVVRTWLKQLLASLPLRGTRLSIFALHSSKISLATARISFQSLIMSSLVVRVEVTVNRITYLPFRDAGTAWRFPRWFNRFKSYAAAMCWKEKLFKKLFSIGIKLIEARHSITFSVSSFSPFKRNTTMPASGRRRNWMMMIRKTWISHLNAASLESRSGCRLRPAPRTSELTSRPP